ncbi:B3 domain-containing transcription factor VRN1-like [Olea europaea subsp. europaea]|uniref:B3 domain-containing transcription factor VRN1-like n=1 Tax=Olea europaea subsp. europaea TaxID=158383 RepID=A0A8S0RTJ6_OLEEU|nr:B3 domain-containing transcription factor VRN1-like [Olea europaea subsp. europaea]
MVQLFFFLKYVRASFATKYLLRYPELIELYDLDGKIWLVRVNTREVYTEEADRGMVLVLSTGWAAFAKAKKIEVGDTCVFELKANEPALKISVSEALQLTDESNCSE